MAAPPDRFPPLCITTNDGKSSASVSIPSKIRTGAHYNHDFSRFDFRGEGFSDGDVCYARIITKDININDGSDVNPVYLESDDLIVRNDTLTVAVPHLNRFTAIEFVKRNNQSPKQE